MLTCTLTSLPDHVGDELGTSRWFEVDQTEIDAFARTTHDDQWIHVDPDRAQTGPFGTTIAHGYLTLSLVSAVLLEILAVKEAASAINYGLDKVRFPSAVPVGSRLRGRGELVSAEQVADGMQTMVRITMELEGNDRPACVAEVLTRWVRS